MKQPSPESYLPLKPHWFHVLLSLADQEQHGYGIMQEVLDRTSGKVRLWPATLYGTIKCAAGGPGAGHSRQARPVGAKGGIMSGGNISPAGGVDSGDLQCSKSAI
jgi:hypothetical protein